MIVSMEDAPVDGIERVDLPVSFEAWGGLGASLGPAVILSLYWRKATRGGVVAGMIAGALVTIAWRLWLQSPTGLYHLIPAFFCAAAVTVIVSLISQARES